MNSEQNRFQYLNHFLTCPSIPLRRPNNINPLAELTVYRPTRVLCPSSHILHLQRRLRGLYRLPKLFKTHDTCLFAPFRSIIPQIHIRSWSHRDMNNSKGASTGKFGLENLQNKQISALSTFGCKQIYIIRGFLIRVRSTLNRIRMTMIGLITETRSSKSLPVVFQWSLNVTKFLEYGSALCSTSCQ